MNFAQMLAMDVKPLPDTHESIAKKWQRATDAMPKPVLMLREVKYEWRPK